MLPSVSPCRPLFNTPPILHLHSPPSQFVAGTKTGGSGPPGFPSLTTIKSTAELRKIGVNVFGMASRKESLILQLKVGWGRGCKAVGLWCWMHVARSADAARSPQDAAPALRSTGLPPAPWHPGCCM